MPLALEFILMLFGKASTLLQLFHSKAANTAGTIIDDIDQVTLAVLQENARIKGLAIDWADPAAVIAFVQTLPKFTPIPAPGSSAPST
jgi:hypothetical protein